MIDDIPKRHGGPRNQATALEILPAGGGATVALPEFIRLPKPGKRCYWTGLARSAMNELVLGSNPKVASLVLARGGADRGVRLVHLGSLLDHLRNEMVGQLNGGPPMTGSPGESNSSADADSEGECSST
ncbi:MAG TPA: hypothetical protein PLA50_00130 [Bacteroidia bacterium]|nr:hypothetical protein [Bacteroidia bacterium]